jgi:hypothetical protein
MELVKKTTILFSPRLHQHLSRLARQRGVSLGELVRAACKAQYGYVSPEDRLRAARELRSLRLPVDTPTKMKRQSVPGAKDLLP